MATTKLLAFLAAQSVNQATLFINNRQDDGQFSEFEYAEDITVPDEELDGWVFEFSAWLNANAEDMAEAQKYFADKEPIDIHDFVKKIEDRPALQVKRALMSYFGESVHNSFDGWDIHEAETLTKFMTDFILGLESGMEDNYKQDCSMWGVDIKNKE